LKDVCLERPPCKTGRLKLRFRILVSKAQLKRDGELHNRWGVVTVPTYLEINYKQRDEFLEFNVFYYILEGNIDMPANFVPEAVAPIIRFMYTGQRLSCFRGQIRIIRLGVYQ
jgi:hypothetical protein